MKTFSSEIAKKQVVGVNLADRWQVYNRLQELDIPCWCEANQALVVEIDHPLAAVQLWCVMRRLTASRQELIQTLEHSWQKRYRKH